MTILLTCPACGEHAIDAEEVRLAVFAAQPCWECGFQFADQSALVRAIVADAEAESDRKVARDMETSPCDGRTR